MSNCTRLTNRTVLVTGAASGIGSATARRAASEGAKVVLTDIQNDMGRGVAAEIQAAGGSARYLEQDVTSEARWREIIEDIKSNEGSLWGLVNNAGIGIGGPLAECTLDEWRNIFAVNVESVFLGCKHGSALMIEGEGGSIVNISSIAGISGSPSLSAYCGTKGAVRLFSKAIALEFAHGQTGVRCNSVHPGIIDTPIWDPEKLGGDLFPTDASENMGVLGTQSNSSMMEIAQQIVPGGQHGSADHIAAGIAYLLSDDASYVTGSELVIDHGITS